MFGYGSFQDDSTQAGQLASHPSLVTQVAVLSGCFEHINTADFKELLVGLK